RDRVAQHLRDDRRPARPGLDHVLGVLVVLRFHLLEQVVVDERTLLQAPRHGSSIPFGLTALAVGVAAADDQAVARQALATRTPLGLTLGVDRVAAPGGLGLTTARPGV